MKEKWPTFQNFNQVAQPILIPILRLSVVHWLLF